MQKARKRPAPAQQGTHKTKASHTSPSHASELATEPHNAPDLRRDPDLLRLGAHACLVARDAVMNVAEGLAHSSSLAFVTVKECEAELDEIDRYVDERIAGELTSAPPKRVKE